MKMHDSRPDPIYSFMVDYHIHTPRCGHASGELSDYVERCIIKGISEIGIADHFPLLHIKDPRLSMSLEELPYYVEDFERLRDCFPKAVLKLGVEADYVPSELEKLSNLIKDYPFDYVYGAVHYIDGWGFDDPRYLDGYGHWDLFELWSRYFETLGDAAECGIFDILAHPDLIKKFGFKPDEDLSSIYLKAVRRIAKAGVTVEVNTAGLRKPVGEIYPSSDFLMLCKDNGVAVTLGSDAHNPEEVGAGFDLALEMLNKCGYEEIAVFRERRRSSVRIN